MSRGRFVFATTAAFVGSLLFGAPGARDATHASANGTPHAATTDAGCLQCHGGIEEMHPWYPLGCTECHGGDGTATTKERAHVAPSSPLPGDERVLPRNHDPAYLRFRNPTDLRVAQKVCGDCHGDLVSHLEKSLHGTTAGHLGDGFYEHGLVAKKHPAFSIFPVRDLDGDVPEGALAATTQVPGFASTGKADAIATHYTDLPRKACMQCHLWNEGRAVRGRLGLDGDYRGSGCAACHVTYADDGRSRSRDATIDKREPGHPLEHRMTSRIPTDTCTRCHYGDASIGLNFRGLAQMVPGQPGGPEVPGTTDTLKNGVFYVRDPELTPPDLHHTAGMHCIDCHTLADTMGDGNIWPNMDHAVEIECTDCHGTIERVSDLQTSRGRRIKYLVRDGDAFFLLSKVTGKRHPVVQVKHVVDPQHPTYNARAAAAMTSDHARLECYTCHSGWNPNFFGFHFDRNEQFTQLDLLSGQRSPGRTTTQEKVFATFSQFRLGFNHEGMIAPYMVGFSTVGSAHDGKGRAIVDQAMPVTAAGLSGVSLIPHQTHTTSKAARDCVECHRSGTTYGLGSVNFRLVREYGFAIDARGLVTIAIDRKTPARTAAVATLRLDAEPAAMALVLDPLQGRATHAIVATNDGSLVTVSLRNPVLPQVVGKRQKSLADPRRLLVQGGKLYAADGVGGVAVFDVEKPERPRPLGVLATTDARAVALQFPWLLVADGAGGLVIADVGDATAPKFLGSVDLNGESTLRNEAFDVAALFQFSRWPAPPRGRDPVRTRPRNLAFVAAGLDGVVVVDFTEPGAPVRIDGQQHRSTFRFDRGDVRGIAVNTVFDLGTPGGGLKSQERDYVYAYVDQGAPGNRQQYVRMFDLTDPLRPRAVPRGDARVYGGTGRLATWRVYNAPFLQHFVVAAGAGGIGTLVDVGKTSTGASVAAVWDGVEALRDLQFEEFAFDRLVDESGRWEKDISHEGCRYLTPDELAKVLRAPIPVEADRRGRYGNIEDDGRPRRTR